ncbi:glycosyltransferase family 2 protein [Meiothermus granaticius]|uniref:Chondroitin synthase n=1 Tax=Meiothermus granaticius NBRC 107808 TaxID=1227551 RepID=A0A399F6C6_9DEIN|nr:glycosyltransferase [Meiothermus granaticius]RIH91285.1 Chondroitin synthase [Meiothermus granaticius NBRC 107808]GEM86242.1 hypothetical protein MGR01S_08670 [Meiothermus granaticius NBRC 107808]
MISVIVPTHNRRAALERKLRALEGQPGSFEVIVVADGCTDDTQQFLAEYHPPYSLRVLETGRGDGRGVAFARNRGAEAARGDLLLFSDDDVVPQPGWIQAHQNAHSGASVVAVGRLLLPPDLRNSGAAELRGPRVFWWNITGNNTSLPKPLFEKVGGYDEAFSAYGGEDPDLGYRLGRAGARIQFVAAAEAVHEAYDHQKGALARAKAAGEAHVRVWKKYGDPKIAWALGVHPVLLGVKMATLPWLRTLIGPRADRELAYSWGAWNQRSA